MGGLNLESGEEITKFVCRRGRGGKTYVFGDEIGAGEFGIVREAVRDEDALLFAAKNFMKETVKPFLEIELMKQIDHVRPYPDSPSQTRTDTSLRNISSDTRMKFKR